MDKILDTLWAINFPEQLLEILSTSTGVHQISPKAMNQGLFPQVQSLPDVRMRLESRTTRSRSFGSLWYLWHQNKELPWVGKTQHIHFLIDRRSFSCKVDFLKWVTFKNHLYWTCCFRWIFGLFREPLFFWKGKLFQLFSCTFLMIGFGVGIGAIFLNLQSWVNEESRATSVFNFMEKKTHPKNCEAWICVLMLRMLMMSFSFWSRFNPSDVQLRCKMACFTLRKVVPLPLPPLALWPRIPMNPTIPKPSRNPLHVIWSIPWLAHVSILPCRTGLYTAFVRSPGVVCGIGQVGR